MCIRDRIKRELLDEAGPRPVLLLGAGASVKSGVPSAAGFTEMIARWAFLRDQGRSEHDPVSYTHLDVYKRQPVPSPRHVA